MEEPVGAGRSFIPQNRLPRFLRLEEICSSRSPSVN